MDDLAYVVVLNWNGESCIRECLRSVLNQTYSPYRVLVVDNGSTDGSPGIIASEFPEASLIGLPENRHFARGSNVGMQEALKDSQCSYVVTLNNDTRVDPEWLHELVRASQPHAGMTACKMLFMDRTRLINSTGFWIAQDGSAMDRGWNQPDEGQFDEAFDVFGPTAGAALYRRELLQAVGLFDEDFLAYYEDLDLAWRGRLAGWDARFAPRSIVYHKFSASFGKGGSFKTYLCERNRIWNLIHNYPRRYVPLAIPWNFARVLAGPIPWNGVHAGDAEAASSGFRDTVAAMARARIDAYAGLSRAFAKRRERRRICRVDARTVGGWLRRYGLSLKDAVAA